MDLQRNWLDRHWLLALIGLWIVVSIAMLGANLTAIGDLMLADTDDNLRLAQVRAWLDGQGWNDLRQYRLAAPIGADIHWSRIPDIPIAALIVILTPFLGANAENWAVAIAPLFPFGIGLWALALTARRLVASASWPFAVFPALCATALMPMWVPLRIDHHGWQLAMLAVAIAGLVDARKGRGGLTTGIASAISLAIGLEMLVYLVALGGLIALLWIADTSHVSRLRAYGASLAGGTAMGYGLFVSQANSAPVCDALSPVWLSAIVCTGAVLAALSFVNSTRWQVRLTASAIGGTALAVGFAFLWPDCLGRPEGVSPELQRLWLDNVSEAKPVYARGWRAMLASLGLPLAGLAGYALFVFRNRSTEEARYGLALALLAGTAMALTLWQARFVPGAQLLAIPGAAALGWYLLPKARAVVFAPLRILATVGVLALATGIYAAVPLLLFPEAESDMIEARSEATDACMSRESMAALNELNPAMLFAPIDMGPRLIVMTHHNSVAGPYHRNGAAILATIQALSAQPDRALSLIVEYDADYVAICPGMTGETIYGSEEADSLFARLSRNAPPQWLEPVELDDSSISLWRVRRY